MATFIQVPVEPMPVPGGPIEPPEALTPGVMAFLATLCFLAMMRR